MIATPSSSRRNTTAPVTVNDVPVVAATTDATLLAVPTTAVADATTSEGLMAVEKLHVQLGTTHSDSRFRNDPFNDDTNHILYHGMYLRR